jgi:hypothetical protein
LGGRAYRPWDEKYQSGARHRHRDFAYAVRIREPNGGRFQDYNRIREPNGKPFGIS